MEPGDYLWILIVGILVAALDAFGIGANDVANSFATSVSSGSLTLRQACCIAIFTEFLGAFLLGSETAKTISSKIISISLFEGKPELLMFAMLCALIGSSSWVIFATRFGWPVSSTHAIVGALIGVGISGFGTTSINWGWGGIGEIIAAWFISPAFSGILGVLIFLPIKYFILGHSNSFQRGLYAIPVVFTITAILDFSFIITQAIGDKNTLGIGATIGVILGLSALVGLLCQFLFVPWLKRRILGDEDLKLYHIFFIPFVSKRPKAVLPGAEPKVEQDLEAEEEAETTQIKPSIWIRAKRAILYGVDKDVTNLRNQELQEIHDTAAHYDDNTEYMFSFLQVITASLASFAHGSNDVGNAVGPISAIIYIYNHASITANGQIPVPVWILVFGGGFIDIGLLTYGYNIMRSLGNKITYHSPSRGFSMELSASTAVLIASYLGLPVSTTHCITGSTAAVGLCNGKVKAVNWKMLSWCLFSWILTLPAAGTIAGLIFAFGTRSPSLTNNVAQ